jgi:hypothetical protein
VTPAEPDVAVAAAEAVCEPFSTDDVLMTLIQAMEVRVEALEEAEAINGGQARALSRHLANAERQAKREEYCAARDQLAAFREQLEDLASEGALSDREAYELRHSTRVALSSNVVQPGEANEYAPGAIGEVRTVDFNGEQLRVEVIDGLAIFNGDVILGFVDELDGAAPSGGPELTGPCRGCGAWTETIKFSYGDDWGLGSTNAAMRERVLQAVNHWRDNTAFSFEVDRSDPDVIFRNSMGCSSPVGRQSGGLGPQYINISTGCGRAAVIHEIGHTIGLWHEQSRGDRDDFVQINLEFVREGREFNFDQFGSAGRDVGGYDYRSIMHYGCADFRRASASGNPIDILDPTVTCADVGVATGLTDQDIAGAYALGRIEFGIAGASDGDVADRFDLTMQFTSEPVADRFLRWWVSDVGLVANGPTFSTADVGLANGDYTIRAEILIGGVLMTTSSVDVTIANAVPVVTLDGPAQAEENRLFTVFAEVTDDEDGSCAPPACTYTWDPAPAADRGGAADYLFGETGPQTISVSVEDGAGGVGGNDLEVLVINSPPTAVISNPPNGSVYSSGSIVGFEGTATDPNVGPGPDPAVVPCFAPWFSWSSSDPSDVINLTDGCNGTIELGDPGTRTLTLEVDYDDGVGSTSITLVVEGCGAGGCAPDLSFELDTPPQLNGASFDPPFVGPGYLIDTELQATASISDPDTPATTITYEWTVRPPCFGGCDAFVVSAGSLLPPNNAFLAWMPSSDPRVTDYWPTCTTTALPFVLSLVATDLNGNSRTFSRTVYLACDLI